MTIASFINRQFVNVKDCKEHKFYKAKVIQYDKVVSLSTLKSGRLEQSSSAVILIIHFQRLFVCFDIVLLFCLYPGCSQYALLLVAIAECICCLSFWRDGRVLNLPT